MALDPSRLRMRIKIGSPSDNPVRILLRTPMETGVREAENRQRALRDTITNAVVWVEAPGRSPPWRAVSPRLDPTTLRTSRSAAA